MPGAVLEWPPLPVFAAGGVPVYVNTGAGVRCAPLPPIEYVTDAPEIE